MKKDVSESLMKQFVRDVDLSPSEAYYVVVMEGLNRSYSTRRKENDYVYFAKKFITEMSKENRLKELSIPFLDRLYVYPVDYLYDLVNICFFPDDIDKEELLRCITIFYEFFVLDNFDYGEHKFEVIKNYFSDSKDDEYFWYKVLMAIDLNLLSNNAEEIALILEKNSAKVLKDYLLDNEIIMNQMNKEEFFKQLGYINDSFLQRKYIKKKIK